jgi:hypothetical protein
VMPSLPCGQNLIRAREPRGSTLNSHHDHDPPNFQERGQRCPRVGWNRFVRTRLSAPRWEVHGERLSAERLPVAGGRSADALIRSSQNRGRASNCLGRACLVGAAAAGTSAVQLSGSGPFPLTLTLSLGRGNSRPEPGTFGNFNLQLPPVVGWGQKQMDRPRAGDPPPRCEPFPLSLRKRAGVRGDQPHASFCLQNCEMCHEPGLRWNRR